jgi:transcriptional regulator with XRE-family HTH domain
MFVVSFGVKRHILKAVLEVIRMKRLSLADLAETIKSNRIEKGITQEQLCKKTGINRNMIGRIERMDYIPTIPQLEKLAEVLDFDVDRLFVENNQSTVFTAFRGSKLSDEERAGAEHLMEMMLAARQQIMLRKALHHE